MWYIGEHRYSQIATVWEIEDHETYALVKLGTSRKDKRTGEYANSNWSYVRFVADAYKHISELEPKMRIVIKSGGISREPYVNHEISEREDGRVWPKYENIVVFAWGFYEYEDNQGNTGIDTPPVVEEAEEEESSDTPF